MPAGWRSTPGSSASSTASGRTRSISKAATPRQTRTASRDVGMLDALSGAGGAWPLAAVAALGAFHGLNPAMGWLLAVALAMQAQRRAVIWRALAALSAGHGLA